MPDELVEDQTSSEQEPVDVSTPDEGATDQDVSPQVEEQELLSVEPETETIEGTEQAPAPQKKWNIKGNNETHELTEDELTRRAEMSYGVPNLMEEKKRIQEENLNYKRDVQRFLNDPRSIVDHLNKHGFDWSQVQQHQQEPVNLYPIDEEYADDTEKQRASEINQFATAMQREVTQLRQQVQIMVDERSANQLEGDFNAHRDKYGVPETAKEAVMKVLYAGIKEYGPSRYTMEHALNEVASGFGIGDAQGNGQLTVEDIEKNPELTKQLKAKWIEEYNRDKETINEETKAPRAKSPAPPKEQKSKIKGDSIPDIFGIAKKRFKEKLKKGG